MARLDVNWLINEYYDDEGELYRHPLQALGFECHMETFPSHVAHVTRDGMRTMLERTGKSQEEVANIVRRECPAHIALTFPPVGRIPDVAIFEQLAPVWETS